MDDGRLISFVDSGSPNDPVHVVRLRDAPEGSARGTIRGPLPEYLVYERVNYARSEFTQRNDHGELEYLYFPAKRFR